MVTTVFDHHSLAGKIGAFTQHSRHDARVTTQAARSAFLLRFEAEVDPDGVLPEDERQRRAASLRRAHMARLALRSAKVRAKRRRTE